ncbi:MAG TPA: hypothetical protein VFC46_04515 [Humisphaera sp.]|nr:hypothetical protein [Humisphaera sp.]
MPERAHLKIGDRIRLLRVPEGDLQQRERELREVAEDAGSTADAIERIIDLDPVVTIDEIDEFGTPWFHRDLVARDGSVEYHSLAIIENESWCMA